LATLVFGFDDVRPSRTVESLLAVVDADPTGIFWG
jgi:hypothetical protein